MTGTTPLSILADALRSAVILGVALAAMPLLRRAPASARRLVLALALGAAALVPVASRAVPGWRVLPATALPVAGTPFAEPPEEAAAAPPVVRTATDPAPAAAPAVRRGGSFPWGSALMAVWALGALAVLGRLAVGVARARGIVRRAAPVSRPAIEAAIREAGAPARVRVRATDEVDAPAVTGVLSPVVLVPRAALGWSAERWRAVLLHELAHVRQQDCLAHMIGQVACAWSWFDPLAWVVAHRLRTERELAADERALATGTRATDYAGHLLAIAASAGAREVPVGALGMAGRSELPARIEAIVRPGGPRPPVSAARAAVIAGAVAALLGAVACVGAGTGGEAGTGAAAPPGAAAGTGAGAAGGASTTAVRAGDGAPGGGALAEEVAAALGAPAGSFELTIRPEIQAIVDEEMKRLDGEWHPVAATAIVLDPATGGVLALAGPATAAAPRATGSTMKPLVVAGALEDRVIAPGDRFSCDDGRRKYPREDLVLRDASPHGELDVAQILEVSSNIGASRIFDKLGGAGLGKWLKRFHLGEASGLELRAPAPAAVAAFEDGSFAGAVQAVGHGRAVASPAHMAAAFAAFANQGVYNSPTLVRRAGGPARAGERLLRPETASAVTAMLERVVTGDQGTGKAARVEGVRVAGKTGTAEEEVEGGKARYYASFIGFAPAEAPRFVVLVGAAVASEDATGGRVAAPVFARIVARALGR